MNVVRRCPNCGTTRATAGQCDACHEAEVRFYCTDHTPGLWLDGPTCPQCHSRAKASARPPMTRGPRAAAAPPTPTRRSSAKAPPLAVHSPPPDDLPEVDAWITRDPPSSRLPRDTAPLSFGTWVDMLRAASSRIRSERSPASSPLPARRVAGCVVRLLLFLVVAFLALVAGAVLFGRALLGL